MYCIRIIIYIYTVHYLGASCLGKYGTSALNSSVLVKGAEHAVWTAALPNLAPFIPIFQIIHTYM